LEGETIVLDLLTTSDLDLVTTLLELFDLSGFTFLGLSFSAELPTSTKLLYSELLFNPCSPTLSMSSLCTFFNIDFCSFLSFFDWLSCSSLILE